MKTIDFRFLLIVLISIFSMNVAKSQCTASFIYSDNGNGNFSFTNTYAGNTGYVMWSFGDGNNDFTNNPVHTFFNGWYEVCLTIGDSVSGCTSTVCDSIEVTSGLTPCNLNASFTYVDNGNGTFTFTNTSGSGLLYSWNFGDGFGSGNFSSLENPTYTYSSLGTYYVSLNIYDTINNCNDSIAQQITYIDTTCNVTAGFTFVDNGGGNYSFTNTSVGENYYYWNFGDASSSSYSESPNHVFAANGTYQVCVQVGDTIAGCYDNTCQTITVTGVSNPICNYNVNVSSYTGTNSRYFSTNYYNMGSTYFWDFGDGNSSTLTGTYYVAHAYSNSGTYYYCLTIDSCPPVCDSVVIDVCDYYISAYQDSLSAVHFSSNAPYPASYFWDFGDGNTSTQASPNYTYAAPGTYYYCLTVDSCPTVCDSVVVIDACNVYAFFSTYNFGNGNYAFYNYSGGSALNGLSAYWNFGDGNTSNTYDANHTYTTNGTYVVVLAVMNSTVYGTCMDYFTATITITDATSPVTCNAAFVMYTDSSYNGVIVVNSSTGSNLSYFWDFGDGNTSTQAYPNYTYSTAGPFYLCLTVTGDSSCTSTYCDSIDAGGIVLKQNGFNINVISPITLGINDEAKEFISSLQLYPNPVRNELTIELELTNPTTVEVFVTDLLGKTVANIVNEEINVGTTKFQWNTSTTKNGIYLLNIISNHSRQVKKVVVNR